MASLDLMYELGRFREGCNAKTKPIDDKVEFYEAKRRNIIPPVAVFSIQELRNRA